MNHLECKLLNYMYEKSNCEDLDLHQFCQEQYQNLNLLSNNYVHENLELTEDEFEIILTQIYNVLKLRISNQDFRVVIMHYVYQLSADITLNLEKLNLICCIDRLWYLSICKYKNIAYKYEDAIVYIQNQLYRQFSIEETQIEKMKRKLKTFCLSRVRI